MQPIGVPAMWPAVGRSMSTRLLSGLQCELFWGELRRIHTDADLHRHADGDADRHQNPDGNDHPNCDLYPHAHAHRDADPDGHADAYTAADRDSHRDHAAADADGR